MRTGVLAAALLAPATALPAAAKTTLGTIRGTISDPQENVGDVIRARMTQK